MHGVVCRTHLSMDVIAGDNDELESLIGHLVLLVAPDFQDIPNFVPVETQQVALSFFVLIEHADRVRGYISEQVIILWTAPPMWDH